MQEDTRDTTLVSMDVKSLYTNIGNHGGIEEVKEKLNTQSKKPIATKFMKFYQISLPNTNF